ncbi:MAG: MarR family transcriptional regulator [Halonotius sp.]
MPITSDEFEDLSAEAGEPAAGTNADRILSFLREHPERAFTQSEIAAETGVKTGSVGPTLVRLRERGRVDHREPYWRVSDHERSVDDAGGHGAATLSERERGEPPRLDAWEDHAVDPRTLRDDE